MSLPRLRLLADDLTGALDTAAEFSALCGPVPVRWDAAPGVGSAAFSTATREAPRAVAVASARAMAPALAGADLAYRKLDSLLRGQVAAELAACWATGLWTHGILAPAFPGQGRIARDGQVLVRQPEGGWQPIPMPDWAAEGLVLRKGDPGRPLEPGLTWFDAETDGDLAQIAALGRQAGGAVLWAGSGGLARALAGAKQVRPEPRLEGSVLGLFGSDQAATARQLAACGEAWLRVSGASEAPLVARRLAATGSALVSLALPGGLGRDAAAARIAREFAALLRALPRPGTLLVAGGETLRAVCGALGAESLRAEGIVMPGVPRSRLQGGAWDGLLVISKSGAFGRDALWRDLLAAHHPLTVKSTA